MPSQLAIKRSGGFDVDAAGQEKHEGMYLSWKRTISYSLLTVAS